MTGGTGGDGGVGGSEAMGDLVTTALGMGTSSTRSPHCSPAFGWIGAWRWWPTSRGRRRPS